MQLCFVCQWNYQSQQAVQVQTKPKPSEWKIFLRFLPTKARSMIHFKLFLKGHELFQDFFALIEEQQFAFLFEMSGDLRR